MLIGFVFMLSSCGSENINDDKINIMVSILPQVEFVEKIGGDLVNVSEMIPFGFNPTTYEPTPEKIKELSRADAYVKIGILPFETSQMGKLIRLNRDMKVIESAEGIRFKEDLEHGLDPHIWMSPKLVKIQVENIFSFLVSEYPEHKEIFKINRDKYLDELELLDTSLEKKLAGIEGKSILVFHPVLGYLAEEYNFKQRSIEVEGKDPTIKQLEEIISQSKRDGIKTIFVQEQFSSKSAEVVAKEIGGVVVRINPLAKDYISNMEKIADLINNSLK